MLRLSFSLVFLLSTMSHAWGGLRELIERTEARLGEIQAQLPELQARKTQAEARYDALRTMPRQSLQTIDRIRLEKRGTTAFLDASEIYINSFNLVLSLARSAQEAPSPEVGAKTKEVLLETLWAGFWRGLTERYKGLLGTLDPRCPLLTYPLDPSLLRTLRGLLCPRFQEVYDHHVVPTVTAEKKNFRLLVRNLRDALDAVDKHGFFDATFRQTLSPERKDCFDRILPMIRSAPLLWSFLNHETDTLTDPEGNFLHIDTFLGRSVLTTSMDNVLKIRTYQEPSDFELYQWHVHGVPVQRLVQRPQGRIVLQMRGSGSAWNLDQCQLLCAELVDVDPTTFPPLGTPPWLSPAPLPTPALVLPPPIIAIPAAAPPLVPAIPPLGGPPAEQPAEPLEPLPRPADLPAAAEEASPAVDPDAALRALFPGWHARHRETVNALNDHKVRELPFLDVIQLLHALNLEVEDGKGSHYTVQNEKGAIAGLARPHKPGAAPKISCISLRQRLVPVLKEYLFDKGITGLFAE